MIVYFSWIREQVGIAEEHIVIPDEVVTLAHLAAHLAERGGGYGTAFADLTKLRAALDMKMTSLDTPLGNAREIAFFPPVTGG